MTGYLYDTNNNLTRVTQNSSRQRFFTYDSLSRLLTSANPETGTITYTYDNDGNVATKLDARGITKTYGYDALDRLSSATYSNSDPSISIHYDESNCLTLPHCDNIGHRTSATDAAGSEAWSFDVSDRMHRDQRTILATPSNITKSTTYSYDYNENIISITYPSNRIVNYTFDKANRPSSATDGTNGFKYLTGLNSIPVNSGCATTAACYTAQNALYGFTFGPTSTFTGLSVTQTYNSRLQSSEFKASSTAGTALDITYNFVDPVSLKDAGHVYGITNNIDSTRSQSFSYDQVNRISAAQTISTHTTSPSHCWGEIYNIDVWSNLQSIAATTNPAYTGCTVESGFSQTADAHNHLSGFGYDASGNTSSDGTYSYVWNAESQLKSGGGVTYLYDVDGQRRAKVGSKLYWYGPSGEVISETDATGHTTADYIFFAGKHIGTQSSSGVGAFYVEDSLGSSRVLTTTAGVVCYDADFYPYGGERAYVNTCPQNYKFEGKERDTETLNDNFGARYYSNRFGRWLSSDWSAVPIAVPYANLSNPQTLNLYGMSSDDPETFADLDGHCVPLCEVVAWISTHIAQVGLQDSTVRKAYSAAVKTATSAERDALKTQARDASSPFGRSVVEQAAQDPGRVAARAAKTSKELAESAGRTSPEINAMASKAGAVGKSFAVVAVVADIAEVATAPTGQRAQAASGAVVGTGGALLGGELGATIGALLGGPPGAALGGIAGSLIGGYAGDKGGREMYNDATQPVQSPTGAEQPNLDPEVPWE